MSETTGPRSYTADRLLQVNGVRLHYADVGDGRPVILVHGNGEDHHLFTSEITQLCGAGYRVLAPDSRGHGANERLHVYHYADMAEDMYRFIRALAPDKPLYYGHSDGGIIGLLLEIMHPGTLGAMAVSGANLSPEGILPGFIEECRAAVRERPDPLISLMLNEPHIDPAELEGIRIPVLVTAGENDLILREETLRIARHLPHAELVIVKDADHDSYIAGSEVMGTLLLSFFSSLENRGAMEDSGDSEGSGDSEDRKDREDGAK